HAPLAVAGEPGAMEEEREADARLRRAVLRSLLPRRFDLLPAGAESRPPLGLFEAEAGGGRGIQNLPRRQPVARLDHVAIADLVRVEPERAADPIHLALHRQFHLRGAEAAERAVRRRMGLDHLTADSHRA